jgi:hypothetical protein
MLYRIIYLFIQVYYPCATVQVMKDQPPIFFSTDTNIPFGHTSGGSEIILTDPIYRFVAGGETSPWAKPSCDIFPRGDIPKNRCPR